MAIDGHELLASRVKDVCIDPLEALPWDVVCKILLSLEPSELRQASLVCRRWRAACQSQDIWRTLYHSQEGWAKETEALQRLRNTGTPSADDWFDLYAVRSIIAQRWTSGRKISTHQFTGHKDCAYACQYDDEKLITGSRDRTVRIWDMKTRECRQTLRGYNASILCLEYDDEILVTGTSDKFIIIWDLEHDNGPVMSRIKAVHSAQILSLAINESLIASSSKDGSMRLSTRDLTTTLCELNHHYDAVNAIDMNSDKTKLVSASGDNTLKIWDLATEGAQPATLTGHQRGLASVKWDDHLIVSGGNDKWIKCWDDRTHDCVFTLQGHTALVRTVDCDAGLHTVVSGSYDKSVKVWDLRSVAKNDPHSTTTTPPDECVLSFEGNTSWFISLAFDAQRIITTSQLGKVSAIDFTKGLECGSS